MEEARKGEPKRWSTVQPSRDLDANRDLGLPERWTRGERCPTANRILARLEREGAARASEFAEWLDLHITTVLYHLRQLRSEGLVQSSNRVWYVRGRPPASDPRVHGAGPAGTRLIETLVRDGPMNCSEMAAELNVSKSAVSQTVSRLQDLNLVATEANGRQKILIPSIPADD